MATPRFIIEVPMLPKMEANLATAPARLDATLKEAVKTATIIMQTIAKTKTPVRTGKLRSSIASETIGLQGVVYPDLQRAPYGEFVHEGTGIYGKYRTKIIPKNAKVMATKINPGWGTKNTKGYFIIGRSTMGQRANPFMKYAYIQGKPKVISIMKEAVATVTKELA